MSQNSAHVKNQNLTLENFSGALDWTVCRLWIESGKAKLVLYNLVFARGLRLNLCQISVDAKNNKNLTFENLSEALD